MSGNFISFSHSFARYLCLPRTLDHSEIYIQLSLGFACWWQKEAFNRPLLYLYMYCITNDVVLSEFHSLLLSLNASVCMFNMRARCIYVCVREWYDTELSFNFYARTSFRIFFSHYHHTKNSHRDDSNAHFKQQQQHQQN